ncbi:hypothetical protein [Bacillus thuringiensis]|uniref:Uncharacterized protein n=1 Tax=Bacillus thuringiensis TaxID=1428 RepID=A0A9X6Y9G0_BACTU|nr:hypothetical protein [Bacillus thuringiensis]PEA88294.1 hypothetical protein CON71_19700 [Bacillus thuringiensis]
MGTIIKRRHTTQYAQIHNNPLQHDLQDLRAIGLLSHLMSLPCDWIIYKTQLYQKFSRKNIEAAWKELASKNYIIGFNCYVDGKKQSFYNVSDIPFVSEELSQFIRETVMELIHLGTSVKSLSLMHGGTLDIPEDLTDVLKVQQSKIRKKRTTVPTVQYSQYCTVGTHTKEIYTNKKITNKDEDEDLANTSNCIKNSSVTTLLNEQEISHKPTLSDDDILLITNRVRNIFKEKIQKRSFDSVFNKCINNYKKGTVPNYENYLITSIENKIEELNLRREREKTLLNLIPKVKKQTLRKEIVPNWLHEQKESKEIKIDIEQKHQNQYKSDIEDERKRLMEILQKYKKRDNN